MTEHSPSPKENIYEHNSMAVISSLPPHFAISDSLALQKHVPSDAEAIFTMLERTPDIPKHVAFAKDITRLDDVLPSLQSRSNEAIDGRYAIMAHYTLVGSVWAFPGSEEREFGIGYCLDHAARGNGYATQAATTMVKQLQLLGANEIYFQIITGNTDSIAIPERLGCKPAEMIIGTDFPVEQQRWRLQLKA